MKKFSQIFITLFVMGLISIVSLLILSLLTYCFKWTADKVEIGIMITYILAGFFGGKFLKTNINRKEEIVTEQKIHSFTQKIIDGCWIGTIFLILLFFLSMLCYGGEVTVSVRLFIVWLLMMGSVCVGRIL